MSAGITRDGSWSGHPCDSCVFVFKTEFPKNKEVFIKKRAKLNTENQKTPKIHWNGKVIKMAVLEKVIEQCRSALQANIPIVYIKTASHELIRNIVNSDRVIVRLAQKNYPPNTLLQRPYSNSRDGKPINCFDGFDKDAIVKFPYRDWKYPSIVTWKTSPNWEKEQWQIPFLENYVLEHNDEKRPYYGILQSSLIILYGEDAKLSTMLRWYTQIINVDAPDVQEISDLIKTALANQEIPYQPNNVHFDALCTQLQGFREEEIKLILHKILMQDTVDGASPFDDTSVVENLIRKQKEQKLEGGLLKLIDTNNAEIAGMKVLKSWTESRKAALKSSHEKKCGVLPPKGVLLCGIPGCGKSEAAKATAKSFELPLLQMDVSNLMGKYVGESEHNLNDALELAKAMSPCVLWIDELDKGFSAAGADSDSGGPFKRMFGSLLSWMQENESPCFIFATANNIGGLPKEFFRSGRFDELFAVYLPTAKECAAILEAHMKKAEKRAGQKLFAKECFREQVLVKILDEALVQKDGRPRIAIGADLRKIVNVALQSTKTDEKWPLNEERWRELLKKAFQESSVYGDGDENIDSIAVSYCRLLRKGLKPANETSMFLARDYHPENAENGEILSRTQSNFDSSYDECVYKLLFKKINLYAPKIEQLELEKTLRM